MDRFRLSLDEAKLFSLEIPRGITISKALPLVNNLLKDYQADIVLSVQDLSSFLDPYKKYSIHICNGVKLSSKAENAYTLLICTRESYSIVETRENICEKHMAKCTMEDVRKRKS